MECDWEPDDTDSNQDYNREYVTGYRGGGHYRVERIGCYLELRPYGWVGGLTRRVGPEK